MALELGNTTWKVTLETAHVLHHAPPHSRIGQALQSRAHVVHQVIRVARGGNGAGHRRMGKDELEKKPRPAIAVEFPGPLGQLLALHGPEQFSFLERAIDDHRGLVLRANGQQALLGCRGRHVVIELGEVELLRLDQALKVRVSALVIVGDAEVADP